MKEENNTVNAFANAPDALRAAAEKIRQKKVEVNERFDQQIARLESRAEEIEARLNLPETE